MTTAVTATTVTAPSVAAVVDATCIDCRTPADAAALAGHLAPDLARSAGHRAGHRPRVSVDGAVVRVHGPLTRRAAAAVVRDAVDNGWADPHPWCPATASDLP